MKQKIIDLSLKMNIWLFAVPAFLIFGIMSFFLIPSLQVQIGMNQLLDTRFGGYEIDYVSNLWQLLGESGRSSYLTLELLGDLPFIVFYVITFTMLNVRLVQKHRLWRNALFFTALIPFLAGFFDLVEDLSVIKMLIDYPEINSSSIGLSSAATKLKGFFLPLMLLSLLVNLLILLVKKTIGDRKKNNLQ